MEDHCSSLLMWPTAAVSAGWCGLLAGLVVDRDQTLSVKVDGDWGGYSYVK